MPKFLVGNPLPAHSLRSIHCLLLLLGCTGFDESENFDLGLKGKMRLSLPFFSLAFPWPGILQAQSRWLASVAVNVIEDFEIKGNTLYSQQKHVPIVVSSGHDEGKEN